MCLAADSKLCICGGFPAKCSSESSDLGCILDEVLAGRHLSSVVKQTQHQTSKAWFISVARAYFQWDAERQLSPGSACFGLHAVSSVTAQHVALGQARMGPRKKKIHSLWGTNTQNFRGQNFRFHVYPRGNNDQSWAQVTDQPYVTETKPYISVVWGQCKSACSEPELRSALGDNLCQPPLPQAAQTRLGNV